MSVKVLDNEGLDMVVGGADITPKEYISTPWSNETIQELKTDWTKIANDYAIKLKALGYKKESVTSDLIEQLFQIGAGLAKDIAPIVTTLMDRRQNNQNNR